MLRLVDVHQSLAKLNMLNVKIWDQAKEVMIYMVRETKVMDTLVRKNVTKLGLSVFSNSSSAIFNRNQWTNPFQSLVPTRWPDVKTWLTEKREEDKVCVVKPVAMDILVNVKLVQLSMMPQKHVRVQVMVISVTFKIEFYIIC